MQLSRVVLKVRAPKTLAMFYETHLGMTVQPVDDGWMVGYPGLGASVELRQGSPDELYTHNDTDSYWKIGITLPNVDIAYQQLLDAGVPINTPRQFKDIGYLCHVTDPEGFQIELLQHTFQGNRSKGAGDNSEPLGGGARIGQITLRVTNIDAALRQYRDEIGMQLLSIQPVQEFGFTLYFLAFTTEHPPHHDLKAVKNREWLWQRPYTTLELQHVPDRRLEKDEKSDRLGFAGIVISKSGSNRTFL